jgi:co-chaperonin GroES (HSP10)
MKATWDNMIVETVPPQEITEGGIHIPENAEKAGARRALILKIGPDVIKELAVGSLVMIRDRVGTEIIVGGKPYLVIEDTDVLVVLDDEKEGE